MSHLIGDNPVTHSGMGRLDPRARVVAALVFALVIVSLQDIGPLCIGLCLAFGMLAATRLPVGKTLKRMVMMDTFIIFMIALLPFTIPGETAFTVLGVPASWEGIDKAIRIGLKANAVVLALMALVGSMDPTTLGHALSRLRLPVNLVHLLLFTVRYIDVIHHEYAHLRIAMKCRGFRPGTNRHTYQSFGYLVGMMLVRSLDRSERILAAMKCRGFTGRLVLLDDMTMRARDYVFMAGLVLVLAGLCILEITHALAY